MSLPDEVRALRFATALCDSRHVQALRLSGDAAFATLDHLLPCALSLQDAQLRPTLLLRDDGTVLADVHVARDDERYYLLSEGPDGAALEAWVRQHAAGSDLQVERLDASHEVLSVHGPWAWDLLGACLGPDVLGMPYLSLLRGANGTVCFRAGKTGEYGYELLVPRAEAPALREGLERHGREWELARVSLEALDLCALENWFFTIRPEGYGGLTPLELGLQWRLKPGKAFVGAQALAARRDRGLTARLTCLVADGPAQRGDAVTLDGEKVGEVRAAEASPTLGRVVVAALMNLPLAVPGLTGLRVGAHAARSVSPPVVNNRSLYVSPQRHTWADRDAPEFPPLVAP